MNKPVESDSDTPQAPSLYHEPDLVQNGIQPIFDFPDEFPFYVNEYRVVKRVGEGGAGVVFKAFDESLANNGAVAVKFIRPDLIASHSTIRRFQKESRLQSVIESRYVSRHIEMGEWNGRLFIVSEFVEGVVLSRIYKEIAKQGSKLALRIARDVLKALIAIHDGGVIHRDVKPANIIVNFDSATGHDQSAQTFRSAKLTDFGLARHVEQSESLEMTRPTAILGTPQFMAPEQLEDSQLVDGRSDIYSLGVTLYSLLAGNLPFPSRDSESIRSVQMVEQPKSVFQLRPELGEAVSRVVDKAMAKGADARYQDAAQMLSDIDALLENRPISLSPFPAIPDLQQANPKLYFFEWELDASIENLWPFVSDTNRVNQAIGLPAPEFTLKQSDEGHELFAQARFNGMSVRWQEFPFQWISNRCLSVLRIFDTGPFQWVTSTVELEPLVRNRTRLVHRFQVLPRGVFGRMLTPFQFGFVTKRSLDRLYERIEQLAQREQNRLSCDVPFSGNHSKCNSKLLDSRIFELEKKIGPSQVPLNLGEYLQTAADQFVEKIRPKEFAKKTDSQLDECLEILLRSVDQAILKLGWDIICPACRVTARTVDTLRNIQSHTYCRVCNFDFEVDVSKQIEMVFAVHPEIRATKAQTYCIGGPFHTPHVLAQQRIRGHSKSDVALRLNSGAYAITCSELREPILFDVEESALATRSDVECGSAHIAKLPVFKAGQICISIANSTDRELHVKLERRTSLGRAFSAFDAVNHPVFEELYPDDAQFCKSQLAFRSIENLVLLKRFDTTAGDQEKGDVAVRSYWQRIENHLSVSESEILEAGYEHLLVRCRTTKDLMRRVEQLLKLYASGALGQVSLAIHRGNVVEFATKSNQGYGSANREILRAIQTCQGSGRLIVGRVLDTHEVELLHRLDGLVENESESDRLFRVFDLDKPSPKKEPPN